MRVFSYKIVRDYGFAPNPFKGFCTLATCKPQVRERAQVGDIVIGCGSARLRMVGRAIFAMRVQERLTFSEYWDDQRFQNKKPSFEGSLSQAYGDNIYHRQDDGWIQEDSHHSYEAGAVNIPNLTRDTSVDCVLISNDFTYWGSNAIQIPAHLRDFGGDDVYPNARSHRSSFNEEFVRAIDAWYTGLDARGRLGRPASW